MAPRRVVYTERREGPVCGMDTQVIQDAGGVLWYGKAADEAERIRMTEPAEILILSSAPVSREFLSALPGLKAVVRLGIGLDPVDLQAATELGVLVTNVPEFCQDEVSEHALGLMLALSRKVVLADRMTRRGDWVVGVQESMLPIRRLKGRTLGLVGFGRIARNVAGKAAALGMEIIASDPYLSAEVVRSAGARLLPLAELLSEADVVSLHVPLTPETHHLIDSAAFELMKPGTLLVNTSRGPVVDEAALFKALDEGRLGGAGLDVLEQEPPELPHPLLKFENVVVTCHYGSCSLEAYAELRGTASKQSAQILRGEFPVNLVNARVKNLPQCRLQVTEAPPPHRSEE